MPMYVRLREADGEKRWHAVSDIVRAVGREFNVAARPIVGYFVRCRTSLLGEGSALEVGQPGYGAAICRTCLELAPKPAAPMDHDDIIERTHSG